MQKRYDWTFLITRYSCLTLEYFINVLDDTDYKMGRVESQLILVASSSIKDNFTEVRQSVVALPTPTIQRLELLTGSRLREESGGPVTT